MSAHRVAQASTPADAAAQNATEDQRFMALALSLGRRGLGRTWPNPAVGAVIVKNGIIIGRGWTRAGGRPHAEVEALARAGTGARGATMYVTLEPCSHHGKSPPCADAVIAAGISRVVSALEDPNPEVAGAGHARLRAAGIAVEVGVGEDEARPDHAGHILRFRAGRPHVMLKLAISADGKAGAKTAAAGPKPVAITGETAWDRVHLLRAQSDAIMIGIGTALADDPILTCRLPGMAQASPVRVVLDSMLRLPLGSHLAQTARQTPVWLIAGPKGTAAAEKALRLLGVEVMRIGESDGRLDLAAALKLLAGRGVTRLMVEGGPTLAAALIAGDLVDEAVLFHSAKVVGGSGTDALSDATMATLTRGLKLVKSELAGADRQDFYERG